MKFATIYDLRDLPCWRNHNIVVVYYYTCVAANYKTHMLTKSLRRMANEIGVSLSALRHALRVLSAAGLIEVQTTGRDTVITVATKLVQDVEKFEPIIELRKHSAELAATLSVNEQQLFPIFTQFIKLQELAHHTWHSSRDLLAHFASWYMKNASSKTLQNSIKAENLRQQREEEQRIQEQQKQQLAEQKKNAISYDEYRRRMAAGYYDKQQ